MRIVSIVSTKGGPGKTTVTANLGAFCADANLRTLLIDLDTQPSLSSFYRLDHEATGGIYELIAHNEIRFEQIVSRTCIPSLSLILSNDPFNQLSNLLLHAADGRLRLKNLMAAFADDFDLVLIDTQGARSVMLEMALLASDMAVSPISPDMFPARYVIQCGEHLQPLLSLMCDRLLESPAIYCDENRVQVLRKPVRGPASQSWGQASGPSVRKVVHFQSCAGRIPVRLLESYRGYVITRVITLWHYNLAWSIWHAWLMRDASSWTHRKYNPRQDRPCRCRTDIDQQAVRHRA